MEKARVSRLFRHQVRWLKVSAYGVLGGARKDLGAGEAIVGRRIRKANGSRGTSEGHVRSYDVSSRLYQVLQPSSSNLFSISPFCRRCGGRTRLSSFPQRSHLCNLSTRL